MDLPSAQDFLFPWRPDHHPLDILFLPARHPARSQLAVGRGEADGRSARGERPNGVRSAEAEVEELSGLECAEGSAGEITRRPEDVCGIYRELVLTQETDVVLFLPDLVANPP